MWARLQDSICCQHYRFRLLHISHISEAIPVIAPIKAMTVVIRQHLSSFLRRTGARVLYAVAGHGMIGKILITQKQEGFGKETTMGKKTVNVLKVKISRETGETISKEIVGTQEVDEDRYNDGLLMMLTGMDKEQLLKKMLKDLYGEEAKEFPHI